jgi:hypothetical protein
LLTTKSIRIWRHCDVMSVICFVYFISILHLYITVTCRHTIVFYGKDCFSNIETSSKRLEYLNIFPSFFYLRTYLIKIWFVLYYRRDHTFDVKTCLQQNRYVFDVIVTSWALFVFCRHLSAWNIWTFSRRFSRNLKPRETQKIL